MTASLECTRSMAHTGCPWSFFCMRMRSWLGSLLFVLWKWWFPHSGPDMTDLDMNKTKTFTLYICLPEHFPFFLMLTFLPSHRLALLISHFERYETPSEPHMIRVFLLLHLILHSLSRKARNRTWKKWTRISTNAQYHMSRAQHFLQDYMCEHSHSLIRDFSLSFMDS